MNRTVSIWSVPDDIRLKMRLLCAGRGISMAKLLSDLVEKAWSEDNTVPDKMQKRRMKRLIKAWRP